MESDKVRNANHSLYVKYTLHYAHYVHWTHNCDIFFGANRIIVLKSLCSNPHGGLLLKYEDGSNYVNGNFHPCHLFLDDFLRIVTQRALLFFIYIIYFSHVAI
jgi:hypothetical protein